MLNLINMMLEISRTESGAVEITRSRFDFRAMLRRSAELFSMPAEQKHQKLTLRLPETPVLVCCDQQKLQQVAANLLDNAIKFTPEGGAVDVELSVCDGEIRFSVADTGCGIREEERPEIFKRFYRADNSRSLPGNGLGLSLVSAIVTAAGGSITVEAVLPRGSRFTVRLPGLLAK